MYFHRCILKIRSIDFNETSEVLSAFKNRNLSNKMELVEKYKILDEKFEQNFYSRAVRSN